jgi:hypothetical protein
MSNKIIVHAANQMPEPANTPLESLIDNAVEQIVKKFGKRAAPTIVARAAFVYGLESRNVTVAEMYQAQNEFSDK